jgi:hypothetical protein
MGFSLPLPASQQHQNCRPSRTIHSFVTGVRLRWQLGAPVWIEYFPGLEEILRLSSAVPDLSHICFSPRDQNLNPFN